MLAIQRLFVQKHTPFCAHVTCLMQQIPKLYLKMEILCRAALEYKWACSSQWAHCPGFSLKQWFSEKIHLFWFELLSNLNLICLMQMFWKFCDGWKSSVWNNWSFATFLSTMFVLRKYTPCKPALVTSYEVMYLCVYQSWFI